MGYVLALLVLRLRFPHYCPQAELCDPFNPRNVSRRDIQGGRGGPRLWHQLVAVTSPGLCCPSPGERPRVGLAVGTSCWVPPPPAVLDTNTRTGDPRGGHEHAPASPGGTPAAPCAPGLCSLSSSSAAGGPAATSWGTPMRQSQAPHADPGARPEPGHTGPLEQLGVGELVSSSGICENGFDSECFPTTLRLH